MLGKEEMEVPINMKYLGIILGRKEKKVIYEDRLIN
jgi:hypothetical protein